MGRVTANQSPTAASAAAPPASTPLKHFTHPHELHPTTLYHPQNICTGCKLQASGTMYTCQPCNFTLHHTCAKLPQLITHPSHGGCTLTLLAAASYPGGAFSCDGCGRGGDGWSYHCIRCEFDLHVGCAAKPLKIRHHSHATCDLQLTFKNPYAHSSGFSCDICRKIGSKQWLYRCNSCEYDVHLDCAAAPRPTLQQHHSLPASSSLHHHHQFMHSASSGGMNPAQVNGFMGPAAAAAVFPPPQQHTHLMHSVSAGNYPYGGVNQGQVAPGQIYGSGPGINPQPMMNNGSYVGPTKQNNNNINNQGSKSSGFGNNLMMAAVQGLVEGAAQGVDQTVVQEMIGGDGGGGGGGLFGDGGDGGGGGGDAGGGEDLYPC